MSRWVQKRADKADVARWEAERDQALGLCDVVERLLDHKARGIEPLGGWDLLYLELEGWKYSYLKAYEEAPLFDYLLEEEE